METTKKNKAQKFTPPIITLKGYRVVYYMQESDTDGSYSHSEDFPPTDEGRIQSMEYMISRLRQSCVGELLDARHVLDITPYRVVEIESGYYGAGDVENECGEYAQALLRDSEYREQFESKLQADRKNWEIDDEFSI